MRYVLGLDGGGSKTLCLVADETGRIIGQGRGGPANTIYTPRRLAIDNVAQAVAGAMRAAALEPEQIAAVCASLPMGPATLAQALPSPLAGRVRRAAEGESARWAACPWVSGHVGVTVDGGTGSLARGWTRDGREVGAGGWGVVLGDEGSGYWIGLQALIAIVQAFDGRRAPTLLQDAALEHFGLPGVPALAARVVAVATSLETGAGTAVEFVADSGREVGPGAPGVGQSRPQEAGLLYDPATGAGLLRRHEIAGFCPAVADAARQGDAAAQGILDQAGRELGRLGAAVIGRLGMGDEEFAVVPFGGVFRIGEPVERPFEATILRAAPKATISRPRFGPEVGAVLLALDVLGIGAGENVIGNIESSLLS